MAEEMTPEEQEQALLAAGAFVSAMRDRYEQLVAHNELLTQGLVFLMHTNGLDKLEIDEADAGSVITQLEMDNIHLHMEVDAEDEAALWKLVFTLEAHEDEPHPSQG